MFIACRPLILASASPRRQEFLQRLGLEFEVAPAHIDETPQPGETPETFVRRMAAGKAGQIACKRPEAVVLGADTVVVSGEIIFGKPRTRQEALDTLKQLQGRAHRVLTGFAVLSQSPAVNEVHVWTTEVVFDSFPDEVLRAYVDSGEPMDKAGAYGIQDQGAFLVHSINGSYSTVVGLPINAVIQTLLRCGAVRPA